MANPTGIRVFRKLGRFWTIPNALSLGRLLLVGPITYLVWIDGSLRGLFALVMLAVLTDWLDGTIARWSHTVSAWGKVLDPLADKVGGVLITLALVFRTAEPTLPLWFLGVVLARDLSIVAGGLYMARRTGRIAVSAWMGKAAVAWLALTVLAAILKADPPVFQFCLWMTTAMMVISFGVYLVRFVRVLRATWDRPPPRTRPFPIDAESLDADASDAPAPDATAADAPEEPQARSVS